MTSLDELVDLLLREHEAKMSHETGASAATVTMAAPASEAENSFETLIKNAEAAGAGQASRIDDSSVSAGMTAATVDNREVEDLKADISRLQSDVFNLRRENADLHEQLAKPKEAPELDAMAKLAKGGGSGGGDGAAAPIFFPWKRHLATVDQLIRAKEIALGEPLLKVLIDVGESLSSELSVRVRLMTQLGTIRQEKKEYKEAEEILNQGVELIQGLETQTSNDKMALAYALDALAQCFQDREDFETTEKHRRRALIIAEEILGAEHPDAGYFFERLEIMRQVRQSANLGKDEHSKTVLDKLKAQLAAQGDQPPPAAEAPADAYSGFMFEKFVSMAKTQLSQKNVAEAENSLRSAMQKASAVPHTDPRKCEGICLLAEVFEMQGKENQAKELYEKALVLAFRFLSKTDIHVGDCCFALALIHDKAADFGLAKNYYCQALEVYQATLGPEDEKTKTLQEKYEQFAERVKSERQWKGWAT